MKQKSSVKKFEIGFLFCLYLTVVVGLTVLLFASRSDLMMPFVRNVLMRFYRYWADF